jgi:hypothetical protein
MHTAEPFVALPRASEFEVVIGNLKSSKFLGVDQIPAELIEAGGEILHSEIHRLIKLMWNKQELPHQWKESVVVPIKQESDKTNCSNYRGMSFLSTSCKILSNILLARLIPHADKIIGYHQCGFWRSRSTIDQTFYIKQILEKKWE